MLAIAVALCAGATAVGQVRAVPASPNEQEASTVTMKSEVRHVIVDVVVTDAKGDPVTGLTQKDFKVFENGKVQRILSFDGAPALAESNRAAPHRMPIESVAATSQPAPHTYTITTAATPQEGALNVILWDVRIDLPLIDHPPFQSDWLRNWVPAMQSARLQVIDFIRQKPAHVRYAIILATDRLKLLQGFTEDTTALLAAMQKRETWQIGSFENVFVYTPNPFHYSPDAQTRRMQ
jgi:VWFA-related protein